MVEKIFITTNANKYLQKHQLVSQFQKTISKLKFANPSGLDFKMRKPKSSGIWSFRITKKYRAWALRDGNVLKIYKIDDHQ